MNLIFLSDIILMVLALIALVIASYTDFKKREVANWISFSLIITAIVLRAFVSIFLAENFAGIIITIIILLVFLSGFFFLLKNQKPWLEYIISIIFVAIWFFARSFNLNYITPVFLSFGIFIILTNLMYYGKMSGGADVKLLLALAVVFSSNPIFLNQSQNQITLLFSTLPNIFLLDFISNTLLAGLVFGLIFSIVIALKNKKIFMKKFKETIKKYKLVSVIVVVIGILFLLSSFIFEKILMIWGIFFVLMPILFGFITTVQESSMKKLKSWKELTEGDWLAQDAKIGSKVLKKTADGLTKKDILLIKNAKKKVLVLDGMPFVPVFLIAIVLCLLFGNLFFKILGVLI